MEVLIDDKEPDVIQRLANRDVLLLLMHRVRRGEDSTLGRTVRIMELVVSRRRKGREFLSSDRQMAERMVVAVLRELVADLRGHERMGDTFRLEIMIQVRQVQTDILADNIDGGTTRQRRVHIHHVRIEAVRSICRYLVSGMEIVVALVPMAERHEIAVLQLASFGHARRTGGIKQDE